ncbi:unnamed protein product [Urochloa humidicola]
MEEWSSRFLWKGFPFFTKCRNQNIHSNPMFSWMPEAHACAREKEHAEKWRREQPKATGFRGLAVDAESICRATDLTVETLLLTFCFDQVAAQERAWSFLMGKTFRTCSCLLALGCRMQGLPVR